MINLLKKLFSPAKAGRAKILRSSRLPIRSVESLEPRLALAVDVAFQSPAGGGGNGERWITVLANGQSDVYMEMVATPTGDLFVADNAGFVGRKEVAAIDSTVDNIYVYNGQLVSRNRTFVDNELRYGLPEGYPSATQDSVEPVLNFLLPSSGWDQGEAYVGTLFLNDADGTVLRFDNNTQSGLDIVSSAGFGGQLQLSISGNVIPSDVGEVGVPLLTLNYDVAVPTTTANSYSPQEVTVGAFLGSRLTFDLFQEEVVDDPSTEVDESIPGEHVFVPGVLSGEVRLDYLDFEEQFEIEPLIFQIDTPKMTDARGSEWVPISFGNDKAFQWGGPRAGAATLGYSGWDGTGAVVSRQFEIDGQFNTRTGELVFETSGPYPLTIDNVQIGLRDTTPLDEQMVGGKPALNPQGTFFDYWANNFTLFPGQNLTRGMFVELPNTGSAISIESPLVAVTPAGNEVSLAASSIEVNSPVRAGGKFQIPDIGSSLFGTVTETVEINAATASPSFDIRVADNAETFDLQRSRVLVTQAGSLSNAIDVLSPPPAILPTAGQVYIEVESGDLFVEGVIAATNQSYNMRSAKEFTSKGPYRFTTESHLTGINTGRLVGTTVSATLANDTFGDAFESFETMFSEVTLQTTVERIRVQAGTRQGHRLAFPFPYTLSIDEADSLIVDGVAASSGAISINAGGTLDLLAVIESLSDVSLSSGDAFTVSSPINTSFGTIVISGPSVTVGNAVGIFDGLVDERQTDIRIEATDGPLILEDGVSAINKVELISSGTNASISGPGRILADIVHVDADGGVAVATAANAVNVRATGSVFIDEQTAAVFEVRESPFVTLRAAGLDQRLEDGLSPALYADLYDTERLVVSAENGSIDILHTGTQPLEIGDGDSIRAFLASNPAIAVSDPVVPTVDSVVASTTSPVISGAATLATGGTLSVEVGGATYQVVPNFDNTWSVDLATALPTAGTLELRDGETYSVTATVTDVDGNLTVDETADELTIRTDLSAPMSMVAAGSVVIRSRFADGLLVSDAPTATSGATEVRFATSRYIHTELGYPDTITQFRPAEVPGVQPTVLTILEPFDPFDENQSLELFDGASAADLRLGDRVLIKDGRIIGVEDFESPEENVVTAEGEAINGIYVIRGKQYLAEGLSDFEGKSILKLTLHRATEFDTTRELDGTRYVRVTDGRALGSLTAGSVWTSNGFVNQADFTESNSTPLRIEEVASRAGYVLARAATTKPILGEYNEGDGTIIAKPVAAAGANQPQYEPINQQAVFFDGVALSQGSRVLVRSLEGVSEELLGKVVGLYEVKDVGAADKPWRLRRVEGFNVDGLGVKPGDGKLFTGIVAITQGTLRTSKTGVMYKVGFDSVNKSPFRYESLADYRSGAAESGQPFDDKTMFRTDIGINTQQGAITYQVSSELGGNFDTGSLGRMLTLVHANTSGLAATGQPQQFTTLVGKGVREIRLDQALPTIDQTIQLVSDENLVIDGSRIAYTSDGAIVRSTSISSRVGPISPTGGLSSRRLVRGIGSNAMPLEEVHGLRIEAGGSGSVFRNLSIGGFRTGAGIYIGGASGVLIENVNLGSDGQGTRMTNKIGVLVDQTQGGGRGAYTTILKSRIVGSEEAGVKVGANVDGVRIIGSAIGANGDPNTVGVVMDSGSGANSVGLEPVFPGWPVRHVMVRPVLDGNMKPVGNELVVPISVLPAGDLTGLQLQAADGRRWEIIGQELVEDQQIVLTVEPFEANGVIESSLAFDVEFGYFVDAAARSESILIKSLKPESLRPLTKKLYIGQEVGLSLPNMMAELTRITAIDVQADGSVKLGLSKPLVLTGPANIFFREGARNDVSFNVNGIAIESGSVTVVATDIRHSINDGIQISGVDLVDGVGHQIGGVLGVELSSSNNAIYGSGRAGVTFTDQFFGDLGLIDSLEKAGRVKIQGNYFGLTNWRQAAFTNGVDAASNIIIDPDSKNPDVAALREKLIESVERVDGEKTRYKAAYKAEDNPKSHRELFDFESFDINGNLHSFGESKFGLPIDDRLTRPGDELTRPGDETDPEDEDPPGWWDKWPDLVP